MPEKITKIGVKLPFPELPKLPRVKIFSPFGTIQTPEITLLPKLKPLEMDDRRKEAFRHTLGIEGTRLIGLIPVVGHIIAEGIADMHGARLRELMTRDEFDDYVKRTGKALPTSLATLRTFHDKPLEGGGIDKVK